MKDKKIQRTLKTLKMKVEKDTVGMIPMEWKDKVTQKTQRLQKMKPLKDTKEQYN